MRKLDAAAVAKIKQWLQAKAGRPCRECGATDHAIPDELRALLSGYGRPPDDVGVNLDQGGE